MSHEQNQARNHLELNLQPESLSQHIKEISSDGAPVVAGKFSISESESGRPVSLLQGLDDISQRLAEYSIFV
jgi:hypothetical protein